MEGGAIFPCIICPPISRHITREDMWHCTSASYSHFCLFLQLCMGLCRQIIMVSKHRPPRIWARMVMSRGWEQQIPYMMGFCCHKSTTEFVLLEKKQLAISNHSFSS